MLRSRVLQGCLARRPARIPVPDWAVAYDAETARLDALLSDFGDAEWHAPVRLKWYEDERAASQRTTVAGVIGHLRAVDGLVSAALGLDDVLQKLLADIPQNTPGGRKFPRSPLSAPRCTGVRSPPRRPGRSANHGASRATR